MGWHWSVGSGRTEGGKKTGACPKLFQIFPPTKYSTKDLIYFYTLEKNVLLDCVSRTSHLLWL